jgi:hypothetical protein
VDSGSEARERPPGPATLPPDLAEQSISRTSIILPLDAALRAIDHFTRQGYRVENWEGWVRMRDGARTRSLAHTGSFALSPDPARAAEAAIAGMRRADAAWQRNPEYPDAQLFYGLSFGAP